MPFILITRSFLFCRLVLRNHGIVLGYDIYMSLCLSYILMEKRHSFVIIKSFTTKHYFKLSSVDLSHVHPFIFMKMQLYDDIPSNITIIFQTINFLFIYKIPHNWTMLLKRGVTFNNQGIH